MAQEMTSAESRELTRPNGSQGAAPAAVYSPATDIYETGDHVVLVADMPGVAPEDIDISVERRVLTIRGHVPAEAHDGYRRIYSEYGEGDYERVFTLSEEIDGERIEARHKNGILVLKMPKAESARSRKIEVRAA